MINFNTFTPVLPSTPAAPFIPAAGDLDESSSSKKSSKSSGSSGSRVSVGGLDPSMISYLLANSLESDARVFFQEMETAIKTAFNPLTGLTNYASYKLLLPKLIEMKNNHDAFNKAKEKMFSNDALDEVAITPYGLVYVANPNATSKKDLIIAKNVADITSEDFLITNGILARHRQEEDGAAFNMQYIQSIELGISTQNIADYINNVIQGVKSKDTETHRNVNGKIVEGLDILLSYIDGKALLKETNSNDREVLLASLSYLLLLMPKNMYIVLEAHARNRNSDVMSVLEDYIKVKIGGNGESKYDIVRGMTEEEGHIKLTPAESFFFGKTSTHDFMMNKGGGKVGYVGTAHESRLTDVNGKPLQRYASLEEALNGQFGGYLDDHSMTMGGRLILNDLRVILENSTVDSIELPIDQDIASPGNNIYKLSVLTPDISSLPKVEIAEKAIRSKHISPDDKESINQEYVNAGLRPKWFKQGDTWQLTATYARFVVLTGFADEAALSKASVDLDTSLLTEITNDDSSLNISKDDLSSRFTIRENGKEKKLNPKTIFRGLIFIPVKDAQLGYKGAALEAFSSSGSSLTVGQYQDILELQGKQDAGNAYHYNPLGGFSANN